MKLLVYIQIPISKSKDILITICIWKKGIDEKKNCHNIKTLNLAFIP
jgi:hypothetical protein